MNIPSISGSRSTRRSPSGVVAGIGLTGVVREREERQHQPGHALGEGTAQTAQEWGEAAGQFDGAGRESVRADRGDDASEDSHGRDAACERRAPRRRQAHTDRRRRGRQRRIARRRGRRRHARRPSPSRPPTRRDVGRTSRYPGRPTTMTRRPSFRRRDGRAAEIGAGRQVCRGTTAPAFPTGRRTRRSRGDGRWAGRSGPRRVASRRGVHGMGCRIGLVIRIDS